MNKTLTIIALLLTAVALLTGCERGKSASAKAECSVQKFTVEGEEPVCSVVCSWADLIPYDTGFSNATNVPCSWYGKKVDRR